jgi:phage shock protein PspC (stress-responsive transcriptional regulator)
LGGVCSGLAAGLHVDPLWIRIAFVLLALVQGVGVLLYVVMWVVMPERSGAQPSGDRFASMITDVRRAWGDLQAQFGGTKPTGSSGAVEGSAAPSSQVNSTWRNPSVALGLILLVLGVLFLADNLGLIHWNVIWPVALIVIGVLLLARSARKRS